MRAAVVLQGLKCAAAARSGGGMGGFYWVLIVGLVVFCGVVGYFIFWWWKRKRLQQEEEEAMQQEDEEAIKQYVASKDAAFMNKYGRDLELSAQKGKLQLTADEEKAIADCRAGERKSLMKAIDDADNTCTVETRDPFGRTLLMIAAETGQTRIVDGLIKRRG